VQYFPTADIGALPKIGPDSLGDPALMIVPSINAWDSTYTVGTPTFLDFGTQSIGQAYTKNYLCAIGMRTNIDSLRLDGAKAKPDALLSTKYCDLTCAYFLVDTGVHSVTAPGPFALHAYGLGTFISYAFLAGMRSVTPDGVHASALDFGKLPVGAAKNRS
jgi:hypothetical protein